MFLPPVVLSAASWAALDQTSLLYDIVLPSSEGGHRGLLVRGRSRDARKHYKSNGPSHVITTVLNRLVPGHGTIKNRNQLNELSISPIA